MNSYRPLSSGLRLESQDGNVEKDDDGRDAVAQHQQEAERHQVTPRHRSTSLLGAAIGGISECTCAMSGVPGCYGTFTGSDRATRTSLWAESRFGHRTHV